MGSDELLILWARQHSARSYSVCKLTIDMAAQQGATGNSPSAPSAGTGVMSASPLKMHSLADRHYIFLTKENDFPTGLSEGNKRKLKKIIIKKQAKENVKEEIERPVVCFAP